MAKWKEPTCLKVTTDYADLCARLRGMDGDSMSIKTLDEAAAAIRDLEARLEATKDKAEETILDLMSKLRAAEGVLRMALKYNTAMHGGASEFNKRILTTLAEIEGEKG